jgi:hypothetical protein
VEVMTIKEALELALNILEPFKESGLYTDYQDVDGFPDEDYEEMLDILRSLKSHHETN